MSMIVPLACIVRDCGLPLTLHDRAYVCTRGHSYDIARSGYVSLLQPQDRRSRSAGDSKDTLAARVRLLAAGVGRGIVEEFVQRAASLALGPAPVVIDLGSGSGDALAEFSRRRTITAIGIDLSKTAAEHAARQWPALTWVVANADRRLPVLDRSVNLVLSLHARRNPHESKRVLAAPGFVLVAVPADDDLIELRRMVQGIGIPRLRAESVVEEHERLFARVERWSAREHHRLSRTSLLDLLAATYRGARMSASPSVAALDSLDVTLASDFLLFAPRGR